MDAVPSSPAPLAVSSVLDSMLARAACSDAGPHLGPRRRRRLGRGARAVHSAPHSGRHPGQRRGQLLADGKARPRLRPPPLTGKQLNTTRVGRDLVRLSPATSAGSGPIDAFFGDVVANLTSLFDSAVQDLQGQIVGNLTRALGVRDFYSLFLTGVCQGDYEDPLDPYSGMSVTECVPYSDSRRGLLNVTRSIPSHFVVGSTNVSIPLVAALAGTLMDVSNLAVTGSQAMFVLLVVGAAASGLTMLCSLAVVILSYPFLVLVTLGWALLAEAALVVLALAATGLVYGGTRANGLASAVGVRPEPGRMFVEKAWVAAALAVLAGTYWLLVWFVDFRKTAFSRRRRKEHQIGDWRGVWTEVWRDLKVPRQSAW